MPLKTTKTDMPAEEFPPVADFVAVQSELINFMQTHQAVFAAYINIAERYNSALESADKQLRALSVERGVGISCGPFMFQHFNPKYDADALLEQVGPDVYEQLGGEIKTIQVRQLDKAMIESQINRGAVPADLIAKFVKMSPNYKKPDKVEIP